ncbi:ASCH domain protein [mine drainage metagenome]|uniref:ASCH domain protein n=2 Tax=mine drainage metagenome TaxID=410659 RepID=T1CKK7_9ZZZZ
MVIQLPNAEFGFPGPLRDRLVTAILNGSKVATTSLELEFRLNGESLPVPGERSIVVDSDNVPVGIIETVSVKVIALGEVRIEHAIDEGEAYQTVSAWRLSHEKFWQSDEMRDEMRDELGDPDFEVDDSTLVVLERFNNLNSLITMTTSSNLIMTCST